MRRLIIALAGGLLAACTAGNTSAPVPAEYALAVRASGCGPRVQFGSAGLVADGVAITTAHTIAGASEVWVLDAAGQRHDATVIGFNPDLDIAVLNVATIDATPLPIADERATPDDMATLSVLRPVDGSASKVEMTGLDVEILRRANVNTTDIYLDGDVTRSGFEIAAAIEPGDSGAVVVVDGQATGVVWSRSRQRDQRAWVVDIDDTTRAIITSTQHAPVSTGPCT